MTVPDDFQSLPLALAADEDGHIFELPGLYALGMQGIHPALPELQDYIPLPFGSDLYVLPDRHIVAFDPERDDIVQIEFYRGRRVRPVAAFLAPAYTQLYQSAYSSEPGAVRLPLYAYTAVGWLKDDFYVTAVRVDQDPRQDLSGIDEAAIASGAESVLERMGHNRLAVHLVQNCVRRYGCPAARNFVLKRYECPLPTSPSCNADCVGCISRQPSETGVVASQSRLNFVPSSSEIAGVALEHIHAVPGAVVSFGQGCEGEPLMQAGVIEQAIKLIRKQTRTGTINLNTNASLPEAIERLCQAGLDSLRVSMNSVRPEPYHRYFRPRGYCFDQVLQSMEIARSLDKWISLNYFIFPGFTNQDEEINKLLEWVTLFRIDMIQMRNLNIDPQWYIESMGMENFDTPTMGILDWMKKVKQAAPWIRFGYFNPALP
ncbi:radical SAM protein [candidate division KSB1 bacterium]|nr:radical SAM protein [candidate division KSB1 bacterium]